MAHELDIITGTNDAAMFSVRETPWHRLGKVLADSPSLDEALRLGGLDWRVEKVAHLAEIPCDLCASSGLSVLGDPCARCNGKGKRLVRSKDGFSVVRMDRPEVIGTVGSQWKPLQNEEAFGVLRPLLDTGLAHIETGGSLRRGKQVWMLVRFDTDEIIRRVEEKAGPEDAALAHEVLSEVLPYGLFTNDHSGGAKARIKETAIRVVCANTFGMAMGRDEEGTSVEVSHSGDVAQNYTAAANLMLQGVAARWAALANARRVLQETSLPTEAFNRLVLEPAIPIRHLELKVQRRDTTPRTMAALQKASDRRDGIQRRWYNGIGHEGSGSAWEAYQGFVEWADHDIEAIPGLKGGNGQSAEKRARSLHSGVLSQLKARIGRNLLAYATADEEQREAILSR